MKAARRLRPAILLAALALLAPGPAVRAGHVQNPRRGLEEIGFHRLLNAGFNTDVWAHRTPDKRIYAFSGTWGVPGICPSETDNPVDPQTSGVKVLDVTRTSRPRLVAKIATVPGAQNNDVKALRVRTDDFRGDVLVHSLEPCGGGGALQELPADVPVEQTGFALYDIRDPRNPAHLADYNNGGLGTHNLFPYRRRDLGRAFVAAVFNELVAGTFVRGELQIVEITDPSNPTLVGRWELADEDLDCPDRGDIAYCFLHDVQLSADGKTAYLSFWDAGLILLDVTNPEEPRFIGQALTQVEGDGVGWLDEEGNTHSAFPVQVGRRRFVVVDDEDFDGGSRYAAVSALSPPSVKGRYKAVEWGGTPPVDGEGVTGPVFYAGGGCTPADYADAPAGGFIALVELFECDPLIATLFQHKLSVAESAGATGLILIWDVPFAGGSFANGNIPAVNVGSHHGAVLRGEREPGSLTGVEVTLHNRGPINPWGFVRILDVTPRNPNRWRQVDTFTAPHTAAARTGEGIFSVHNPWVVGRKVYFSWYTDGIRVVRLSSTGKPREVAWFVPLPRDHQGDLDSDPYGVQPDNAGFWGVYLARHPRTGQLLIFASDINRGIYILG